MYRLVALDLDDTLLHTDLTISLENQEAIQRAIRAGVIVMIATGRMYASAVRYARQLGLDVPLITYQGALVKTSQTAEVWYERLLSPTIAGKLVEFGRAHGLHTQLYQNDTLYVQADNQHIHEYKQLSQVDYQVADLAQVAEQGSIKGLFSGEPQELDERAVELRTWLGDDVHIFKSKPYYLEVTHAEATKGQALAHVAHRLGIQREEIMACGDSWNDIDMLQYAGLGVVMENAPADVQAVGDVLTAAHTEAGVAKAIYNYVLDVK